MVAGRSDGAKCILCFTGKNLVDGEAGGAGKDSVPVMFLMPLSTAVMRAGRSGWRRPGSCLIQSSWCRIRVFIVFYITGKTVDSLTSSITT